MDLHIFLHQPNKLVFTIFFKKLCFDKFLPMCKIFKACHIFHML